MCIGIVSCDLVFRVFYLLATRVMDLDAIRHAVQRFRFERFDVAVEEFDYLQRFETELDLHDLLQVHGDAAAGIFCYLELGLMLLRY